MKFLKSKRKVSINLLNLSEHVITSLRPKHKIYLTLKMIIDLRLLTIRLRKESLLDFHPDKDNLDHAKPL